VIPACLISEGAENSLSAIFRQARRTLLGIDLLGFFGDAISHNPCHIVMSVDRLDCDQGLNIVIGFQSNDEVNSTELKARSIHLFSTQETELILPTRCVLRKGALYRRLYLLLRTFTLLNQTSPPAVFGF
jgi:hypothetical protein